MKSIRDTCIELFQNEDIKKDIKCIIRPVGELIYNQIYVYVWIICAYHVFFVLIGLANLYLLLKMSKNWEKTCPW
jgi:hypothetical protein